MAIRIDLIIHKRTAHFYMIEIIFNLIKMRFHIFVLFLSFSLGIYVPNGRVRKSNVFRRLRRVFKMDQNSMKLIRLKTHWSRASMRSCGEINKTRYPGAWRSCAFGSQRRQRPAFCASGKNNPFLPYRLQRFMCL